LAFFDKGILIYLWLRMEYRKMSSAEFSDKQAFKAILEWSIDRPRWQRDALRRLVMRGPLAATDIDELTAICCDEVAQAASLEQQHLKPANLSGHPISILRVVEPKGINALPADQTLEFAEKGLSVIYGDNGSGKSGYVRILKHACRTRDGRTSIRRDIEDTSATPQSATIVFSRAGAEDTYMWTPQAPAHPELPSVSIFDTRSANIHVEKTNAVAYIPEPMQVMEALAAACDEVKERIDRQIGILRSQTPRALSAPTLSRDTAAGAFVHALSATSSLETLAMLATLSEAESKRLVEIQSDLSQDPQQAVAHLRAQRVRLQSIRAQLTKLCVATNEAAFNTREALRVDLDRKVEAARLASERLFAASPLPEVGQDIWRTLWDAARRYSDQVAYPTRKFPPATAGSDLCVLCQQPLSEEAVQRQQTFEAFIQGITKADEIQATKAFENFMAGGRTASLASSVRRDCVAFFEAEIGDKALAAKVRSAVTHAAWRLRALAKENRAPVAASEFPENDCAGLDAALSQRIAQLSADDKSPERQALLKEYRELKDRQGLGALLEDIKAEIKRLQEIAKFEKAARDAGKRPVTNKNKELSDKLVTNALRGRFAREVEKLKLSRMPVELRKVKDNNAISYFQVALVEKPTEPIGEILSEGEHRCIALAAFLAELVTSKQYSGIVFDDPMSSLDHIHRKAVATRLVEEAAHRQVIVFTHDLTFLYELRREAEAKGQTIHYQTVSRRSERPGHVEGELPNKARSALQLANVLRSELKAIRAEYDRWPDVRRTIVAKGIVEQLREAWDQAIADFIYPVLGRFDNQIKGGSLYRLAVLQESDVNTVTMARKRLSEDLHVSAQTLNPANVTHTELVAEVKKLEDYVHDIETRQKAAVAPGANRGRA
jgi:energy-coupling factor transporter ATP-binding protein EcfA2